MKKWIGIFIVALVVGMTSGFVSAEDVSQEKEYWPSGKVRVLKQYDQAGDLEELSYYREDGTLEQHEKYDMYGHKAEESYYGEGGKLIEGADGWAAMQLKYENGKLRQESYYGGDGRLKERKLYDEGGNLVGKQYVGDGSIDPDEEFSPRLPLLGHETTAYYDSYGREQGETSAYRE
ncbi:MAG: hypothetical protein ABID83_00160 [Candidatus Omnitrophota bacterium]